MSSAKQAERHPAQQFREAEQGHNRERVFEHSPRGTSIIRTRQLSTFGFGK
jgi:hypothetical protein